MLTELTQAQVVNGAVPISALCSEAGRHRRIGLLRPVAPLVVAVALGPLFARSVATQGAGLAVELAGVAAGLVGGCAALSLMSVRHGEAGRPVTRTGWPFAAVWVAVFGARAAFCYGSAHWFPAQLARWGAAHQVPPGVITDGLIFMAIAMLATSTLGTLARAAALGRPASEDPEMRDARADP